MIGLSSKRRTRVRETVLTLQRSERFIRRCLCLGWSWDAPAGWKSGCSSRCRSVVTGRTRGGLDSTAHRSYRLASSEQSAYPPVGWWAGCNSPRAGAPLHQGPGQARWWCPSAPRPLSGWGSDTDTAVSNPLSWRRSLITTQWEFPSQTRTNISTLKVTLDVDILTANSGRLSDIATERFTPRKVKL